MQFLVEPRTQAAHGLTWLSLREGAVNALRPASAKGSRPTAVPGGIAPAADSAVAAGDPRDACDVVSGPSCNQAVSTR